MTTPSPPQDEDEKVSEDFVAAPLSDEVLWYLESRGYPALDPEKQPLIRTPEPKDEPGAVFDPSRVDRVVKALSALRHTKGKWAGRPLTPNNLQVAYFIAPIFGWVAPDAEGDLQRIIREVFIEMPRKSAKTTLASGLATVLAFADNEPGAEVIIGAASRDQAGQAFKPVAALAKSSKMLADAGIRARAHDVLQESTGSFVKVVSSRGDLAHGANVHAGVIDELHVHKKPDLLEAIESGTGARAQPIVFIITTADDGQTTSVYAERRQYIERLSKGILHSPSRYGVVFAARKTDDPFAESTWNRSNPLYPITPTKAFMQSAAEKAQSSPVQLASFLRLHLGIRAKQDKEFFNLERWDANASIVDKVALRGASCYGGIDLGAISDLTALVWLFPDTRGGYDVVSHFWLPENSLSQLDARTSNNAREWVKDGYIMLTPGDVTDYDFVKARILKDYNRYVVEAVGYDPWNALKLVNELNEEQVPMVRVPQTVSALSAPLKELNRLIRKGDEETPLVRHGNNPVLRWMADNTRVYADGNGNIKPDKQRSTEKIDGISAMTIAMALAMGDTDSIGTMGDLTVVEA